MQVAGHESAVMFQEDIRRMCACIHTNRQVVELAAAGSVLRNKR